SYPMTGSAVSFDGTLTTCSASPCSYRWTDDADGSVLGTGAKMSMTFQQAGTKSVRLSVTDAQPATKSVMHDVIVATSPSTGPSGPLTWRPPVCGDSSHAC